MTEGSERNRVGGGDWSRCGQPGQIVRGPAGALGSEIPEGAIERIARGTGRHCMLQSMAIEALLYLRAHGLERRVDALDGFAIACIGHAFSAASHIAVGEFRNDNGASVLAPRLIAKEPAIGQRSTVWESIKGGFTGNPGAMKVFRQTLDRFNGWSSMTPARPTGRSRENQRLAA